MEFVVAQPFKTVNQRFAVGDALSAEIELEPYTVDSLKAGRFIVGAETKAAEKAAAAAESGDLPPAPAPVLVEPTTGAPIVPGAVTGPEPAAPAVAVKPAA